MMRKKLALATAGLLAVGATGTTAFILGEKHRGTETTPVIEAASCDGARMPGRLREALSNLPAGAEDKVEFMVPAGANRVRNLGATSQMILYVNIETYYKIALLFRVDDYIELGLAPDVRYMDSSHSGWEGALEVLEGVDHGFVNMTALDTLDQLGPDVEQGIALQPMGTSYTEVVYTIQETDADHLVLIGNNFFLKRRLALAAHNAVSEGEPSSTLRSVHVLCHEDNPLTAAGATFDQKMKKEVLSYVADRGLDLFGGHDYVMETSEGGNREQRLKAWLKGLVL